MNVKEILSLKKEIVEKLSKKVDLSRVNADAHSKRFPRPCGLTIHVGIGCPNNCSYCYVRDMGFPVGKTTPYPLKGEELVCALALNKYFIPSVNGTFTAFGSITEPFAKQLVPKTLEYMSAISDWLGNPIQFSTKMSIDDETLDQLSTLRRDFRISPLITIVSIKMSERLESLVSKVEDRFELMRRLRKKGFKPVLFLRPIIPGITDLEFEEIIRESHKNGAVGIVTGSLRVTTRILRNLQRMNIDIKEIKRRIKRKIKGTRQVSVYSEDLKRNVENLARRRGLIVFPSACCANAYVSRVACANLCYAKNRCFNCPNQCTNKMFDIDIEDVENAFMYFFGKKPRKVELNNLAIKVSFKTTNKRLLAPIEVLFRRRVILEDHLLN